MGIIGKIFGSPKKESGNEQYERVTGAKSVADSAYENVTDAKRTGASATRAGSTIHKWGDRISASAVTGKIQSPAFQNFAKNAVASSNNIFGGGSFGGDRDLVGLGGGPGSGSNNKKKKGKHKLSPAFYDPKTGKTYIAKNKKVVAKKKGKKNKQQAGPQEFDPW